MKAVCCCGKASITLEGAPKLNGVCHCKSCKTRTGSAFGWSTYFTDAQVVEKTGDFTVYTLTTVPQKRWFCSHCGTTLFWKLNFRPQLIGVAGGCFIDAALPEPSFTVNNENRCAWLDLPESWATSLEFRR